MKRSDLYDIVHEFPVAANLEHAAITFKDGRQFIFKCPIVVHTFSDKFPKFMYVKLNMKNFLKAACYSLGTGFIMNPFEED